MAVPYNQSAYRAFIQTLPNQFARWTTVDVPTNNVTWHEQVGGGSGGDLAALTAGDAKDGGGFVEFTPGLGFRSAATPTFSPLAVGSGLGYTIMFWMRTGTIPVNGYSLFDLRSNAASNKSNLLLRVGQGGVFETMNLTVGSDPDTTNFRDGTHPDWSNAHDAVALDDNQWHFVAVTKQTDTEVSFLYIDDRILQGPTPTGNTIQTATPADWGTARIEFGRAIGAVGTATAWEGDKYAGGMADLLIAGQPYTQLQIQNAYLAGTSRGAGVRVQVVG